MKVIQKKTQIQNRAVTLSKQYSYLVLEHATGTGKSLSAIRIIEKNSRVPWKIAIAETNHKQNWIEEFKKHGKLHLLKNVTFFCYASLHKNNDSEYYIFDEFHHALKSQKRLNSLWEISKKAKQFIGLSATLARGLKANLKDIFPTTYYYKVPTSEAIEEGILPEPKVYLVPIELETSSKNYTFQFSKDRKKQCSAHEWYTLQDSRIEWLQKRYFNTRQEFHKTMWLRAGGLRKTFLTNYKTPYAQRLLKKIGDKKMIVFTHTIAQSEQLSKGNSIHSKVSTEVRQDMIDDFNSGKITRLFTTRMLRESMNLEGIEVGVTVQLDNNIKSFTQMIGRVLRSSYPEYYILYVKNTQDERYLETALEGFNKDYIYKYKLTEYDEKTERKKFICQTSHNGKNA